MLPFELCNICSLLPGKDKLAFSVFIELNEDANVIRHEFSKTVLRSCAQLSYDHAQVNSILIRKLNFESMPKKIDF